MLKLITLKNSDFVVIRVNQIINTLTNEELEVYKRTGEIRDKYFLKVYTFKRWGRSTTTFNGSYGNIQHINLIETDRTEFIDYYENNLEQNPFNHVQYEFFKNVIGDYTLLMVSKDTYAYFNLLTMMEGD